MKSAKKVPIPTEKRQLEMPTMPYASLMSGSQIGFARFFLRPYSFYVFRPRGRAGARFRTIIF